MKRTSPVLVSFLSAAVACWAVGCQTDSVSQVGEGPREAIAYAATAKYPGGAETPSAAAAAPSATPASATVVAGRPYVDAPVRDTDKTSPAAPVAADASPYRLAVIDRRGEKQIEILNLSDTSIPASTVWVNGLFVTQVAALPPRGTLKVKYDELLEAGRPTGDLRALDQNARKVELQVGDKLYAVDGPAIK